MKLLENVTIDFDIIGQLLIRYSAFVRHRRENGSTVGQYIRYS